jgi:hypothetical protein
MTESQRNGADAKSTNETPTRKRRSDGAFEWRLYGPYYKRCSSERCNTCLSGGHHGPYYQIARTNPITRKREIVYLGETPLPDEALERINAEFKTRKPLRRQVLDML